MVHSEGPQGSDPRVPEWQGAEADTRKVNVYMKGLLQAELHK